MKRRPRNLDARIEAARAKIPPREMTVAESIALFLIEQQDRENPGGEVRDRGRNSPYFRELVAEVRAILKQTGDYADPDEPISNFSSKP
jgi:hypothetical protein